VYLPITTRQLADGTVEIAPSGEIDLDNAHVMRDAVNDVLTSATPGRICLDLQRVMLIDSIGIGILVACFHAAAASGVKLVVSHPSPTVYRQLWVSGLVGLLGCAEPPSPRTSVGLRPASASPRARCGQTTPGVPGQLKRSGVRPSRVVPGQLGRSGVRPSRVVPGQLRRSGSDRTG